MVDPHPTRKATLFPILVTTVAVIAGACGGGGSDDEPASPAGEEPATGETAPNDGSAGDGPAEEDPPASTVAPTTESPTTDPPETTAPAAPNYDPVPSTVEDLPDLVIEWDTAVDDPAADPLDLTQRLIGFPLPIPVPEGSSPHSVDLDLFAGDPAADWRWEWAYTAHATQPVGDVDINLEDKGAGTVELAAIYDPIMADLGWRRTGTTTSDPGDPGGPNSVNHVYTFEGEPFTIAGVAATPDPAFIWLDEDLVFGDEEIPGYRVDINVDLTAGEIVVPLLASLHDALPAVEGARLTGADLTTWSRDADSFDAEEGLNYIDLELTLELPAGSEEAAMTAYSQNLDEVVIRAADESFFDPGFFEPAEPSLFGGTWEQPIILLDRYPGRLTVATDAGGGPVAASFEVRLEPNREQLLPLPA